MTNTAALSSTMDAAVGKLRDALREAQGSVGWFTDEYVKANIRHDGELISTLDGSQRQDVLAGKKSFGSWLDLAKTIASDLSTQMSIASRSLLKDFFDQVVAQSAVDLKQGVVDVASKVDSGLPWVTVAAVAVLLILVLVRF